jgi:hypothetical protein
LKSAPAWARTARHASPLQSGRATHAQIVFSAIVVRRLLVKQATGQWRRYALAFGLMGIAAASTALSAFLVGDVINQAYVHSCRAYPSREFGRPSREFPLPAMRVLRACRYSHSPLSSHIVASDLIWQRYPHFRDT